MTKRTRKTDEYLAREAAKYDRPIPSREFIMDMLADQSGPLGMKDIARMLELHEGDDLDALRRRLRAMERDGQLVRNRRDGYGLVGKMQLIRGRIIAHPDGFGFLVPDDGSDDLFMTGREMRALFHNDRIVACVSGMDRRGRREGAVVEVLERNTHQIVGRFHHERGVTFVVPDNKRITHDIMVPPENTGDAEDEQIVVVELVEQPSRKHRPMGRIVEILGAHMAPGMEIDVAIRAHELPFEWSDEALTEVQRFNAEVDESAKQGRKDLRDTPLVTIDGADARDFDDAVFCEPLDGKAGNGWRLLVAIADVANYVKPGSGLDEIAIERGNSVYFPGRVIPMLPEQLSNGLCSINPDVDRLCMVCEMTVNSVGKVTAFDFYNGVMRSHARLIYDDVAALLDGDQALRQKHKALVPHLEELHKLFNAFLKQRKKRGAIEFETTETVIEFGEEKKIDRIVPLHRNDAHRLIEECMIAANISAAKYLDQHEMPTLYRVHETPKQEKLSDLRDFLKDLGITLGGGDKPEAKHYATVLEQVSERPDRHLIQTVLLRSMNQAVYSPENVGHFGLSLENYAHFTSPIRRYPDLLVHRALKHCIKKRSPDSFAYDTEDMATLGESCSMTERRADDATRDVVDWLKCEYMMDKVGDVFEGIVTGVTGFGMFIELDNIYVEGLVHITALKKDYYRFDPVKHSLIGERTHNVYRLADKVEVRVVRVDLDEKRIDFELAGLLSHAETGFSDKPKSGKGKRSGKGKKGRKNRNKKNRQQDSESTNTASKGSGEKKKSLKKGKKKKNKNSKKKQGENPGQNSASKKSVSKKTANKKTNKKKSVKKQTANKQVAKKKTAKKTATKKATPKKATAKKSVAKKKAKKKSSASKTGAKKAVKKTSAKKKTTRSAKPKKGSR